LIFKILQAINIVFFQSIIYLIAKNIPKDKNLTVIGSSLGRHFADNSKYLYLYFQKNNTNNSKRMIWITKNKEVNEYLKSLDFPSEYLYSLKGIFYTIRASKVFITHQLRDINGALIAGAQIIQLWHGIPIKKVGYKGDWSPTTRKGRLQVQFYNLFPFAYYMKCDKLITSSKMAKDTFVEPFSLSFRNENIEENILLLGQPRNDALLSDYIFDETVFSELKQLRKYKSKYKQIISWLPTHRMQTNKTIVDIMQESNLDLALLDEFLKKKNILFVIKAHFLELGLVKNLLTDSENIIVYSEADPYPLLHFTDILVTDYSSVFFDFLVTDKPIVFAPFDYDEYSKTAKFYYDYYDITPGKKCFNWKEIEDEIINIINGNDFFEIKRKKLLKDSEFIINNNCNNIINHVDLISKQDT